MINISVYIPFFLQVLRFGIVGLTAAGIQLGTVILLVQWGRLEPLTANIFGFAFAFQMSYWGHRLWTFNQADVPHRIALPKLLFIQSLNLTAHETLFYVFLTMKLPYPIALIIVLTIMPIFTFITSKVWVFRSYSSER